MATVAQLAALLGGTALLALMPEILSDLGADASEQEWMVTAHFVVFGALLFVGGHLADVIGRKTTMLIGLAGCVVTTAIQATASAPGAMLWGYIGQGAFAALTTPASFALVAAHFTEQRSRAKAFGVYSLVGLGGSALSLILAVLLAQNITWRVCLYVAVLLAVVALVGTATLVRDLPDRAPAGFDGPGALLGALGLAALFYGFEASSQSGGGNITSVLILCFTVGIILLGAFFRRQSRTSGAAILPSYDTGARERIGALITLFLTGLALALVMPLFSEFLWSTDSGLVALPVMVGSFLVGSLVASGRLLPRVAPHVLLVPGLLLAAVGVLLTLRDMTSPAEAFPILICLSVGLGMAGTVLYSAITEGVAPGGSGGWAALAFAGQGLGGSAAVALIGGMAGGEGLQSNARGPLYVAAAALAIAALVGGLMIKGRANRQLAV
ncbi:MFS transporter [Streptomyces sp. NBC_01465]